MKNKYKAIVVVREYVWVHKPTGQPTNPTENQKMVSAFVEDSPIEGYNVYRKVIELKADRLSDLGDKYHEYVQGNLSSIYTPLFAPGNTTDVELIITYKGKVATGNTTIF